MSDNNGKTDLDALLERISPQHREAFLRSRLRLKQFSENDEFLAIANHMENFAVLINALTKDVPPRSEPAQGIETAAVEVKRLTEAVLMLEAHLKAIGVGINKLETHCGNLDATLGTFAGVKKHQLWQLIAISMGAGAVIIMGFQLLLDWMRPILHI
jgi:hypothetical protein